MPARESQKQRKGNTGRRFDEEGVTWQTIFLMSFGSKFLPHAPIELVPTPGKCSAGYGEDKIFLNQCMTHVNCF